MFWKGINLNHKTQKTVLSWHFIYLYIFPDEEYIYIYIAIKILEQEPKAAYTHCNGYALNLALSNTDKHCKVMWNTYIHISYKIVKLVNKSLCRDSMPAVIQTADSGSNFCTL